MGDIITANLQIKLEVRSMPGLVIFVITLALGLALELLAFAVSTDKELIKNPRNVGNVGMVRAIAQVFLTCAGVALYFTLYSAWVNPTP